MKDSKEKENRISNLKNMVGQVKTNDDIDEPFNEEKDSFEIDDDLNFSSEPNEEDNELINYLNEEKEELEIDDEFIYNPAKDNNTEAKVLEDETEIDENFIIQTKTENNDEIETESEEGKDIEEEMDSTFDADDLVSKQFDSLVDAKIGKYPIISIIGLVLGVILLIIATMILNSGSQRIIDNVVSGELNVSVVILGFIGILLIVVSIYKLFALRNPFEDLTESINGIDKKQEKTTENMNMFSPIKKEEPPKILPKSEIPLNKDKYKIGEFDITTFKKNLKKPTSKLDGVSYHKTEGKSSIKTKDEQVTLDDVVKAEVKEEPKKVKEESKKTSENKEDNIDNEKTPVDSKSIDEIFASVEEIDEIPILSVDNKKSSEKKK